MIELETLQIVNIFIILITIGTVFFTVSIEKYRTFWLWFVPIFVLLIHSLIFRVVLLIDALDGQFNMAVTTYNFWSDLVHLQDKLTILSYAIAIILQNFRDRKKKFKDIIEIISWKKLGDDK